MELFDISRKQVMELGAKVRELEERNRQIYEEVRDLRDYRHKMECAVLDTQLEIFDISDDESKSESTRRLDIIRAMNNLVLKTFEEPEHEILDTKEKTNDFFADGKPIDL